MTPQGRAIRVAPRASSTGLHATADGRLIEVTDKATYVIDPQTLRVVQQYPIGGLDLGIAISRDGRTLAAEARNGRLRLLDLASGRVQTLAGSQDVDLQVGAFSPDGSTLSTTQGEDVILWDSERGVATETLEGHAAPIGPHLFSPDGRTLYTGAEDSTAMVWDVVGDRRLGRPFRSIYTGPLGDSSPVAFAISPDGSTLAAQRFGDGRVDLIDVETLRRTGGFEAFAGGRALAIEFSPDGRRLAIGAATGAVGVWDPESGQRLGPLLLPSHGPERLNNSHSIQALAFGKGGLLAAASVGGGVRIWDLDQRELVDSPLRLRPFVLGLAFSPDGSQLVIPFGARLDPPGGIEVIDVHSGATVARLRSGQVRSIAFSPDGSLLAAGRVDGGVHFWATDDWGRVGAPLAPGGGQALSVAFSPDGRTLASSYAEAAVGLWDVESRQAVGSLPVPAGPDAWFTARFTPDGRRLFILTDYGIAFRWEMDPDAWQRHACAVGNGGLTPEQWTEVVPEQDYISACPSG